MRYKVQVLFYDNNIYIPVENGEAKIYLNGSEVSGVTEQTAETLTFTYNGIPGGGGYYWDRWRYSTNGGYSYNSSTSAALQITPTDGAYIIVRCSLYENSYKVTYNYNNPTGQGSATGTFYFGRPLGDSYNTLRSSPSYSGFYFKGWRIEGRLYAESSAYATPPYNTTADAEWGEGTRPGTSITIRFDYNNGTGSYSTTSAKTGQLVALRSSPSYQYHTFIGWLINGAIYSQYETFQVPEAGDVTAVAQWQLTEYLLTFDVNGGTALGLEPLYGTSERPITIPNITPRKSGNNFVSWKINNSYYTVGDNVSITSNTSATAQYTSLSNITVTFGPNSGTFPSGAETTRVVGIGAKYGIKYGESSITQFPSITRSGYDFVGWFDTSNSSGGVEITVNSIVKNPSNHTIYARWKQRRTTWYYARPSGKCTFDDYPEQTTVDITYSEGVPYGSLPAVSHIELPKSLFQGWFTSSDTSLSGIKYTAETFVPSSTTYLYSRWALKFIFDANGGSFANGDTQKIEYRFFGSDNGQSPYIKFATLPESPTMSGSTFAGWFTYSSSGSEITVDTDVPTSEKTYYAHWNEIKYTIVFDANGGTVSPSSAQGGAKTYITLPNPTLDGYDFLGWYTLAEGGELIGKNGDKYYPTQDRTIYAHWELAITEVTITFHANGGEFSGGAETYQTTVRENSYLYPPSVTKSGWKLSFYSETQAGGGEKLNGTDSVYVNKEKLRFFYSHNEYYAQWYNGEKLIFSPNGGSFVDGSGDSQKYIYLNIGDTYSNFPDVSSTEYETNGGWWTSSSVYGGTHYKDDGSQTCQTTNNVYLYFRWPQVVTYDANGGTCDVETGEFLVNTDDGGQNHYIGLPDSSKVRKEGDSFKGWYDTKYGGNKVDENTVVSDSNTRTLYAHFLSTPESATIILDADGGTFEDGTSRVEIELHLRESFYSPSVTKDHCRIQNSIYSNSDGWQFVVGSYVNFSAKFFEAVIANPNFKPTWIPVWYYTYFAYDGTEIPYSKDEYDQSDGVFYKSDAPMIPVRRGYEPDDWDPKLPEDGTRVTSDKSFTATYTQTEFYVTFVDWNGTTIQSSLYNNGDTVTPPPAPIRVGYTFVGWEPSNFSPATEAMTVRATYKGQPVAISFNPSGGTWSDGTTGIKVTTQYKGDRVVEPDRPTRFKEDSDVSARGDDSEPTEKKKYVFTGWTPSLGIVDSPMTYAAEWTTSWIPPVTPGTSSFGQKESDYVFIKPPKDFIDNSPKGDPMPIRKNRSEREGKILRWEDPMYLNEWAAELMYWSNGSGGSYHKPEPTEAAYANDRKVVASRLVGGIRRSNLEGIGDYYSGSYGSSIGAVLLYANRISSYLYWISEGYSYNPAYECLIKADKYSPITQPRKLQITGGGSIDATDVSVYGSGVGTGELGSDEHVVIKKDCIIDTVSVGSTAGGYIKTNLLDEEEKPRGSGASLSQNIPLTLYYIAQEMSKAVVLSGSFTMFTKKGEKQEWDESISRDLVTKDSQGKDISPKIEDASWSENWSSEERYDHEHEPTGSPTYNPSKTTRATHDPANIDDGSAKPTITKTEIEETKPRRGSLTNTLMSAQFYESGDVDWHYTSGATEASNPRPYWDVDHPYGEQWVLTWDRNRQYFTYLDDGPNYTIRGSMTKYSEFTFSVGISSIVRTHTSDGESGTNGTFVEPLKFFMLLKIHIGQCKVERSYQTAYSHYYPQVADTDIEEEPFEESDYYVFVPFDAEYIGQTGSEKIPNYTCIYKVSDVQGIIDTAVDVAGIKDKWDTYFANPPTMKRGDRQPSMQWVQENGTYYDYVRDKREGCSGGCDTYFNGNASISIVGIGSAHRYTPWPSIGLPEVAPS